MQTATVVRESTVNEVSDFQKTVSRNVTAVVAAGFTSGLVSPILTFLTLLS